MDDANHLTEFPNRLETMLKNAPVIAFIQDHQLRYRWIHCPFPGLAEEDVLRKTDADFLPQEEASQIIEIKQRALAAGQSQGAFLQMTLGNQTARYFLWVFPLGPAGEGQELDHGLAGIYWKQGEETCTSTPEMGVPATGAPVPAGEEERHRLLASLSRSFAETGNDYPALLETITRQVARAAGDAAMIQLVDEDGVFLPLVLSFSQDSAREEVVRQEVVRQEVARQAIAGDNAIFRALAAGTSEQARKKLLGKVYQTGEARMLPDLAANSAVLERLPADMRAWLEEQPIHASLALPLRTPRGIMGVMCAWRIRSRQPFSQDDLLFWQDVADRAGLAIENARLFAEEVQRHRQLKALHDATTALLSTLNLEELLGRIIDAAQQAIPAAERGILYLIAPHTGRLEIARTSGFNDPRIRRTGLLHNSNANRAMLERQPLRISDASAPQGEAASFEWEPIRAEIVAPLLLGEEVLGALSLSASRPSVFSQADLQLLASFAATTTAALHNAQLHTELQKIAITDQLTGLYNRRGLLELGRHEIERFQRFGHPLSAIMLDIDHFKLINDTYGHPVGDQVLCGLAERCYGLIRQVDILGRYGGEEFAILLPETDLVQAAAIAERLRDAVGDKPFYTERGPISLTISLGVTGAGRSVGSLVALIEQADTALYQAKQKGRNRVEAA